MSAINNVNNALHRINVRLYPNYLPKKEGAYVARINNEASLAIEQVCVALCNRGGFKGSCEELIDNVRMFFDEAANQLCGGFTVNTGYFSIHPCIDGSFNSEHELHDHRKHPINFHLRTRAALRKMAQRIDVEVEGPAGSSGWIDEFTDYNLKSVNGIFFQDNIFKITGHRIKVTGDDPACGVYIVPVKDPSKAVKITRIAENTPTHIIGRAVRTMHKLNKIEIRTQFSGLGSTLLKTPRTITSNFLIEEAMA